MQIRKWVAVKIMVLAIIRHLVFRAIILTTTPYVSFQEQWALTRESLQQEP